MRFLHTADWHLGRLFHGVHLTEDQAYILDQVVDLAREHRPHAVLIAGDVYDRAVPPPDAVRLLDDVLSRLVLDVGVPVVLIAGNHDGPDRLGFGARLLAAQRLHVAGILRGQLDVLTLHDATGAVRIYALPYAEPAVVREALADKGVDGHEAAMRALTSRILAARAPEERSVVVAHAFVAGGATSESERPLSVGGTGAVSNDCFRGIEYAALGHLHAPQEAGAPNVQYAGSLLKYSFSEVAHSKSVNFVEMDELGVCTVERVPLTARHDVRRIHGTLQELLVAGREVGAGRDDYLVAQVTDHGALVDPMGQLREVYPNVLHIERPALVGNGSGSAPRIDGRTVSEEEMFAAFMSRVAQPPTEAEASAFAAVVDSLRKAEREVEV